MDKEYNPAEMLIDSNNSNTNTLSILDNNNIITNNINITYMSEPTIVQLIINNDIIDKLYMLFVENKSIQIIRKNNSIMTTTNKIK